MKTALLALLLTLIFAASASAAPTANFTWSPVQPYGAPVTVSFDASSSICDRAPCTYSWSHNGTPFPAPYNVGITSQFTYQVLGVKTPTLTVRNSRKQSHSITKTFEVLAGQPAPETTLTSWADADSPSDPRDEDGDGDERTTVTYSVTNADGAEYSLDNGAWLPLAASPDANTVVLPGNGSQHNLRVRAKRSSDGVVDATPATAGPLAICPAAGCVPPPVGCDKFASPSGLDTNAGTQAAPFRSAFKLGQALTAGQTGCLRNGDYAPRNSTEYYTLNPLNHGTSSAPVRITSYPGERGRLLGTSRIATNWFQLDHVSVDGSMRANDATFWVRASDFTITHSDISNGNTGSQCFLLGSNASSITAARVKISRNKIHDCGSYAAGNQEHAIYFERTTAAHVIDNLFWDTAAYGMHIYPNSQGSLIEHNVIDQSGHGGVIFASENSYTSSNNEVRFNLVTNSGVRPGFSHYWGGPVGIGNTAHDNCLWGNTSGNFETPIVGYTQTNNLTSDPLYINRPARDYRMGAGSSCLAVVGYDTAATMGW